MPMTVNFGTTLAVRKALLGVKAAGLIPANTAQLSHVKRSPTKLLVTLTAPARITPRCSPSGSLIQPPNIRSAPRKVSARNRASPGTLGNSNCVTVSPSTRRPITVFSSSESRSFLPALSTSSTIESPGTPRNQ
ncbi:MAG: hypothetical protein NTV17_05690 [Burkholderiales bacterium]|nr:hypothetical protein [Burkholderiales bacterium]